MVAIVAGAFLFGDGSASNFVEAGPVNGGGIARAVAAVIWTYDGWIAVSMIAGEVIAPGQLMKRIIVVGMLVIVTLYIGANLAYLYMMPVEIMAQQKEAVARTVMTAIAGPAAGPWIAMLIQSAGAVGMVLVLRDFDRLTTYFVVVEWAALIFAVSAVFVLRRKMADAPRPFRTPGYPWVPLCVVLGTLVGVTAIVWGEIVAGNYSPIVGLGIAAAGFPVHYVWRRWRD